MPARTGCCYFNLQKLDPATGNIIWKTSIYGSASHASTIPPHTTRIESLIGTNDVIVGLSNGDLVRVDSTGAEVWYLSGYHSGGGGSVTSGTRGFDIDSSGNIIVGFSTSGYRALDQSGATLWSGGVGPNDVGNIRCFPSGNTAIVGARSSLTTPVGFYNVDTTTGAKTLLAGATGTVGEVQAADVNNLFLDDKRNVAATIQRDGSTGNLVTTFPGTFASKNVRALPNGEYIACSSDTIQYTDSSGVAHFSLTGVGGYTFGVGSMADCTFTSSGGSGYTMNFYYVGFKAGGGIEPSIFAVDSSGNFLWCQQWGIPGAASDAGGCCISDDGYLYVSGKANHGN